MLKYKILHPDLLSGLARAGHGSQILIADGNYPFISGSPALAQKVFLNLSPGKVTVTDVLEAVADAIPIETARVMVPDDLADQPIFAEFQKILPKDLALTKEKRFDFYDKARLNDTILVVATAEQRTWSDLLLTVGVIHAR